MNEPQQPPSGDDTPQGSPYGEPPWFAAEAYRGNTWTDWLRYHAFPIAVAITVLVFGALFYFAPYPGASSSEYPAAAPSTPSGSAESSAPSGELGSGTATMTVRSQPSAATVRVDGDSIGATPLEDYRITSGVYIVNVQKSGYFDRDTILVLRNDQSAVYAPQLRRSGSEASPGEEASAVRGPDVPPAERNATPPPARSEAPSDPEPEASASDAESPSTGRLVVESDPSGATVQLNGESAGTTPLDLGEVPLGTHQIRLERAGYEPVQQTVQVRAEEPGRLSATLPPRPARLRVLVRPWGSIYVDGTLQVRDTDVWYEAELSPGTYDLAAAHPALGEAQRTVDLAPGDTQEVVIDLRDNQE
jgi:hypothetical protein